jgi:hypothetical protein
VFYQRQLQSLASVTSRLILVTTEPGRKYTIYFTDQALSDHVVWTAFANNANGTGSWIETNTVSTTHVFRDDESEETTGGPTASGYRFYLITVEMAP